ncbi:hypothetical protein GCM10011428_36290 [Streptomyces violaceus]
MIHEVDEVLKNLLSGGALAGSGIDVALDAPTRDWAARRNAPTINAYLYDIRRMSPAASGAISRSTTSGTSSSSTGSRPAGSGCRTW